MIALPNGSNLIASATLSVSSEDSTYPKENLAALPVSQPFRTTSSASQSVAMDFGSAVPVDLIAIINHNLSESATVTVKAGTTSGVSDFSQSITWRDKTMFVLLSTVQTYRYWKVELSDPVSPDSFIQIGYLCIGQSTHYGFGPLFGTLLSTDEFTNNEDETEFGTPHVSRLFSRTRLAWDMRLVPADDDEMRALLKLLSKDAVPVFLIHDTDIYDGYFGRFVSNVGRKLYRTKTSDIYRESSFEFREDGFGSIVAA